MIPTTLSADAPRERERLQRLLMLRRPERFTEQVNIRLLKVEYDQLQEVAKRNDVSISDVIRDAIEMYREVVVRMEAPQLNELLDRADAQRRTPAALIFDAILSSLAAKGKVAGR